MSPIVTGIVASLAGRVTSGIMARLHRPQASFNDVLQAAARQAALAGNAPAWARQMALAEKRQADLDALAGSLSALPVTRDQGREIAKDLIALVEDLQRAIESGVDVDIEQAVASFVSDAADKYHMAEADTEALGNAAAGFLHRRLGV